ncbi:MAG TPA: hypothetical protein VI306_17545 [Pyrinomonadaceae bacterium]
MKYKLKIQGLKTADGTISIRALKLLVDTLVETCERGLRLAFQGESVKPGPSPNWLIRSVDFTFTDLTNGSTCIVLDVPKLGETASDQVKQQDLWYSKPRPEDTAISLVSQSVKAVVSDKFESNAYDKGVLDGLLSFDSFFKNYGSKVTIRSSERPSEAFSLSANEIRKIREIKTNMPEPLVSVISGNFDLIQHSNSKFHIAINDGQIILGTIDREALTVEDMRKFWGKKVTIRGMVHFHPGRRIRLLEAQSIGLAQEGDRVFERTPSPTPRTLFDSEIQRLDANSALHDIWGKWPGDESIDDLLASLTP